MTKDEITEKYVKAIEEILEAQVIFANLTSDHDFQADDENHDYFEVETSTRVTTLTKINAIKGCLIASNIDVYSKNNKICLYITMKKRGNIGE